MKAYYKCPKCNTRGKSKWVMDRISKPFYIVECKECGNVYYQTFHINVPKDYKPKVKDEKVKVPSLEIKPDALDPVTCYDPEYSKGRCAVLDLDALPRKKGPTQSNQGTL